MSMKNRNVPLPLKTYSMGKDVLAFSTMRKGGVSEGNYASFNVNAYCGDSPGHVAQNRMALAEAVGVSPDCIVIPHQVHGVEVRQIGEEFAVLSEDVKKMVLEGVDAVMTCLSGYCIGVSTADCIPVLLYDEKRHAVAAIHAGWRGTVARIVQKTIAAMHTAFGTVPQDLSAVIGPGISVDHFEVGDEVYEQFSAAGFGMGQIAERREKWHINLPLCNELQLLQAGVAEESIVRSHICTYSHADEYFSARKLGVESGRIYTAIMMR